MKDKKKLPCEETKQSSKLDLGKMEVLELSNWELKTTMMDIQRTLIEKIGNTEERMGKVMTEIEIRRNNLKKLVEIKNTAIEI